MSPGLLQTPSHRLTARLNGSEGPETMQLPTETNGSTLTKGEQENVVKKLKKEIYNPRPKSVARRVSLYYRDPNTKATEKHRDGDNKSCAVCLEDFEAREEVIVTPCSHMFHEECIVPWVKNHGHCPVCRASFYEREQNDSLFNNYNNNNNNNNNNSNNRRVVDQPAGQRVLFHDELLSLIQAVDEAFPRRM